MSFFSNKKKRAVEAPIYLPQSVDWGASMRNYCQCEEMSLEDLAELLQGGDVYSFNKSFSLAPVFSAIELISNTIASLPLSVKKDNVVVKGHQLVNVLKNNMLTYFILIKQLVTDLLYHGNAFAYVKKRSNIVVDLIYIPVSDVYVDYDKYKHKLQYKVTGYTDIPNLIEPKNMIHLVKNTEDGINGKGFKHYGLKVIHQLEQVQNAAGQLFKDGLGIEGYYTSDTLMTKKQQADMLESIKEQQTNGKRRVFLPAKFSFISGGNTAVDSQLIENRIFSLQEIARYFNISPVLLGDLSKGGTSSVEDAQLQFLQNTLLPYINIIEQEFSRKCLEEPYVVDLDERELLRTGQEKQAAFLSSLTNAGIMTINEAREQLGLETKEGADELYIPYSAPEQNKISETDENI